MLRFSTKVLSNAREFSGVSFNLISTTTKALSNFDFLAKCRLTV